MFGALVGLQSRHGQRQPGGGIQVVPCQGSKLVHPGPDHAAKLTTLSALAGLQSRGHAQRAKDELDGIVLHEQDLKLGWGKAVTLPRRALNQTTGGSGGPSQGGKGTFKASPISQSNKYQEATDDWERYLNPTATASPRRTEKQIMTVVMDCSRWHGSPRQLMTRIIDLHGSLCYCAQYRIRRHPCSLYLCAPQFTALWFDMNRPGGFIWNISTARSEYKKEWLLDNVQVYRRRLVRHVTKCSLTLTMVFSPARWSLLCLSAVLYQNCCRQFSRMSRTSGVRTMPSSYGQSWVALTTAVVLGTVLAAPLIAVGWAQVWVHSVATF